MIHSMNWLNAFVMYTGIVDATVLIAGGLALCVWLLIGRDIGQFMERVFPAAFVFVGSHILAVLILNATRWLTGL
ncbi:MAG: hypothetical protein JWN75_1192 [Candidatus Saccharibacteria bacterium]|nr:hypothetical protein [Candidatus Saccharibacteria bacterium]